MSIIIIVDTRHVSIHIGLLEEMDMSLMVYPNIIFKKKIIVIFYLEVLQS